LISKKSRKTEIIKDAGLYAGSSYAGTFIDVLNGILMRNLIAPASMGVWSFLQVILSYSKYATLGTGPALVREIPYLRGKGEFAKADQIKNNVFSWSMMISFAAAVAITIYAFIRRSLSPEMKWGLVAIAWISILQRCFNLYMVLLRAYKSFRLASFSNFFSSAITLLLTATVVWKFRFYGLLLGAALGYLADLLILHFNSGLRFHFEFDKKILTDLSLFGFSLVAVQVSMTVLRSVDTFVIAKWLNFTALGYYSTALMFQTYLTILPNVADVVLNPHLFEKAGQTQNHRDLKENVLQPIIAMSCVMPCFVFFSWVGIPWVVGFLMKKYTAGIAAAQILILSTFFLGAARPVNTYLILLKKHLWMIPITLFAAGISLATNWLLIKGLHHGIESAAFSTVFSTGIYFLGIFILASYFLMPAKDFFKASLKILGPFFYMLVGVKCLALIPPSGLSWQRIAAGLAVSALLCVPLLFLMEKETKVVSRCLSILKEKIHS